MKIFFITVFAMLTIFNGCVNNINTQEPKEAVSAVDSLMDEVVAGHDMAMPKMKKLERLQKECVAARDSIAKLSKNAQKVSVLTIVQLDSVINQLGEANLSMEKWMHEFNYDSFKDNEGERIKYLQTEKEKVNKMKDTVLNSISTAESILNRK